ncbi:unnamed protein product [Ceratitis capitata]|uniref:(Mediterranean fruit fly) hypothetical protein n=1 Tax=Ceratitis capitata TaxID=7213 RepID=A0A811VDR6_CERCA|nr:unnamed protein product [Ceratitis capitata]
MHKQCYNNNAHNNDAASSKLQCRVVTANFVGACECSEQPIGGKVAQYDLEMMIMTVDSATGGVDPCHLIVFEAMNHQYPHQPPN